MEQMELEPSTQRKALEEEIINAGGWHAVAKALFPTKYKESPETTERHLRNAVNPDHIQKLDFYDAMTIKEMARQRKGYSALVNFDCDRLNLSRPVAIEPENEVTRLMREYIESVKSQKANTDKMESQIEKLLQAMKPGERPTLKPVA